MTEPKASPCTKQCKLDDENICLGCGRTLEQITNWIKDKRDANSRDR